jgi:tetratricopeptide (TPR) repeat protein
MAYAGLARAYARSETGPDPFPSAEAAARRGLEIDETLTEAVMVLAILRGREWDWAGAEREFQRALKLDPRFAETHGEYAIGCLAPTGRIEQALRESAKGIDLDPLSPFDNIRHGVLLMYARRFYEAESQLQKAYRLSPEYARRHLGKLYLVRGRYAEALDQFASEPVWKAITLAKMGRLEEARQIVVPAGDIHLTLYWAALGDTDKAFEALDRAYQSHSLGLTTLANPVWDPLRSDVRFQELLKRIGLGGRAS